jgi:hypothetical protein
MNGSYSDLLYQILSQRFNTQDAYDLTQLTAIFSGVEIHDLFNDTELINCFYDNIFELIPFVEKYKINVIPLTEITSAEIELLKKVIKAIAVSFDNLPDDELEVIRLVASIFLMVRYIKADFNVWFQLGITKPINNKLLELLTIILSSSNCISFTIDGNTRIYEKEFLTSYEEGLKEGNLNKIYQFIDALTRGISLVDKYFIEEAVSFLFWADLDRLIYIFNQKSDVVSIYYFLRSLSVDEKLCVCIEVSNSLAKVECIREVITPSREELSQEQIDLLSKCLIKLSNNSDDFWSKFLSYFNVYPSRYPLLQKPLGKALASMPDECLIEYVNSLNIDQFISNPVHINECLNSFVNHSSEDKSRFILHLIFQKWNDFMNKGLNSGFKIFNVFFTNFFNAVVIHVSYEIDESQLIEVVEQIVGKLNSVNSCWFDSKGTQISYFHILLSKLFVYSTVWSYCGYSLQKDSHLANQIEIFTTNQYLFQIQSLSKETVSQIGIIRNNFGL